MHWPTPLEKLADLHSSKGGGITKDFWLLRNIL